MLDNAEGRGTNTTAKYRSPPEYAYQAAIDAGVGAVGAGTDYQYAPKGAGPCRLPRAFSASPSKRMNDILDKLIATAPPKDKVETCLLADADRSAFGGLGRPRTQRHAALPGVVR